MLVLSRKTDERIQLGENIEIVVLEIGRNKVKLGINCPQQIPIHRKELLLQQRNSKRHSLREEDFNQTQVYEPVNSIAGEENFRSTNN